MKNRIESPNGMRAGGIGPGIILRTLPFLLAGILLQLLAPAVSSYFTPYPAILTWAGAVLTAAGIAVYAAAIRQFIKLFPGGKLITGGVYRLSRNPIYVSWILFILPGLSLVCNNWVFLIAALAFLAAFQMNIRKEENKLQEVFGSEYEKYVHEVGRIGFVPGISRKRNRYSKPISL